MSPWETIEHGGIFFVRWLESSEKELVWTSLTHRTGRLFKLNTTKGISGSQGGGERERESNEGKDQKDCRGM